MPFASFLCPQAPIITSHCSCCYHENAPPQYSQWAYPSYFPNYTFPIPIFVQPPPPTPASTPSPPPPIPTMAHTALYTALGLEPPSKHSHIKRNYRLLAMKFHPDKTANPATADRFKQISHANDILSSPKRKSIYDKHGEPATTHPDDYTDAGDPLLPPGEPPVADYAAPYSPTGDPQPPDADGYVPAFPDPRGDPFATSGAMPAVFARLAAEVAAAAAAQAQRDTDERRRRAAEAHVEEAQQRARERGRRDSPYGQPRWGVGYGGHPGVGQVGSGVPGGRREGPVAGLPADYGAEYRGTSGSGGGEYGSGYPRMRGAGGGSYGGPRDGGEFARDGYGSGGYERGRGGSFGGFGSGGGAGFGGGWR